MKKKVLIVGGVAGGASASARLRRLDEELEIIIFEKGEFISFANCGLPYHIGEIIKERDNLLLQTPKAMKDRFNIDVRVFSEVIDVDTESKSIKVNSKDHGEYEESYDYLILSPGAKPIRPNIPGINNKRIHTLRNINDMDKIKKEVDENKVKKAIVIGGGYIGVEASENFIERGIDTTLIQADPHILAPFDHDMIVIAENEMEDNGVKLLLNSMAESFSETEEEIEVCLTSGEIVKGDLVVLAIGVTPDVNFIKNSGIELGKKGHILVNENLETNKEGIYAVGDAIEVIDLINGKNTAIPLAGPANRQGRMVADNICGSKKSYKGTLGTAILKVFGLTAASTGNNERMLKAFNMEYQTIYIHPNSHAGYYPGATQISIKLMFNKEGKILGAQALGYDGVDKVIDVIATVIKLNGTVDDLKDLELAYAPPYNSAKSPANMLGFVAENILTGQEEMITLDDLNNIDDDKQILLDVREDIEWEKGHIDGAQHIPLNNLRERLNEITKDKEIWVYCQVGVRGHIASRILKQHGFRVKNLTGGYKTYISSKFSPKKIDLNSFNKGEFNEVLKESAISKIDENKITLEKDLCGLCCPGPLMGVKNSIDTIKNGEILKVKASDPGFYEDIKSWCHRTNNELKDISKEKGIITAVIKKGGVLETNKENNLIANKDNKTMVVFSGDLDKAIASFIIANGAASMGKKVTMFFTFWGINILRKSEKTKVSKTFMETMFGKMMPKGTEKLKLSQMNMGGIGPKLIRKIMKDKNVSSLEELVEAAIANGVEIVACQMSMDLLGFKNEELIDGVKIGGVGYYLGEAEDSNVNLFI